MTHPEYERFNDEIEELFEKSNPNLSGFKELLGQLLTPMFGQTGSRGNTERKARFVQLAFDLSDVSERKYRDAADRQKARAKLIDNLLQRSATPDVAKAFYFLCHKTVGFDELCGAVDVKLMPGPNGGTFKAVYGWSPRREFHFSDVGSSDVVYATSEVGKLVRQASYAASGAPQPPLLFPTPEKLRDDNSNWLHPFVTDHRLRFLAPAATDGARDARLVELDNFVEGKNAPFLVWAISGPSGAGKTRLVCEWIREFARRHSDSRSETGWNIGFFGARQKRIWDIPWTNWVPTRSTVIVIDYIHLFRDDIRDLFDRFDPELRQDSPTHQVRLLLVDHTFPDGLSNLQRDARYPSDRFSGKNLSKTRALFYREEPLKLRPRDQDRNNLRAVMEQAALLHNSDFDVQLLDPALDELNSMAGAWCPLFAALRGRAVAMGSKAHFNNRRELIDSYLSGTGRLPWLEPIPERRVVGQWVGSFVAAATVLNGARFDTISRCLPSVESNNKLLLQELRTLSCDVVSRLHDNELAPFEPDILGESFFLLLLDEILELPVRRAEFFSMCNSYADERHQEFKETLIVEFLNRTNSNLLNDSLKDPETLRLWSNFANFLSNFTFSSEEGPHHEVLLLRYRCARYLEDKLSELEIERLYSSQGDHSLLYRIEEIRDVLSFVAISIKYEWLLKEGRMTESVLSDFLDISARFDEINKDEITALGILVDFDLDILVGAFLKSTRFRKKINSPSYLIWGQAPLHIASRRGNEGCVRTLLQLGANPINQCIGGWGHTALQLASSNGHLCVVKVLLATGAHTQGHIEIAAHAATASGHSHVLEYLLRCIPDQQKYLTAALLLCASRNGMHHLVKQFMARGAKPEIACEDSGYPAFGYLIKNGQFDIAQVLVEGYGSAIKARRRHLQIALQDACRRENLQEIEWLLDIGAPTDRVDVFNEIGEGRSLKVLEKVASYGRISRKRMNDLLFHSCIACLYSSNGNMEEKRSFVKELAKRGMSIGSSYRSKKESFLLIRHALESADRELARFWIEQGMDIDMCFPDDGETALTTACRYGDYMMVQLFLAAGANPNVRNESEGESPLIVASRYGDIQIVRTLVAAGADITLESHQKVTALMEARRGLHGMVVDELYRQ